MRSIPDVAFNADPAQRRDHLPGQRGRLSGAAALRRHEHRRAAHGRRHRADQPGGRRESRAVSIRSSIRWPAPPPSTRRRAWAATSRTSDSARRIFNACILRCDGPCRGLGQRHRSRSRRAGRRAAVSADGTSTTLRRRPTARREREHGERQDRHACGKAPAARRRSRRRAACRRTSNGAVVFTVKNATVQNVTFTATDVTDGIVLAQTATVTFVVPPATAGGISAFPTTVQNNGVATTTITVTLQDALGRPDARQGGHALAGERALDHHRRRRRRSPTRAARSSSRRRTGSPKPSPTPRSMSPTATCRSRAARS